MPQRKSSNLAIVGISSLIGRASGLLTQIVLAWYLTPADYGLWAIALGITTYTTMFRGGGTSTLFPTLKLEEFNTIGGGLFAYSMVFGVLGALFTLGAALPSQKIYPADVIHGLEWILFWSAIQFVIFTASNYPRMMMSAKFKFGSVAAMDITAALVKLAAAYIFASRGFGAMSFVLSVLAQNATVLVWSLFQSGITRVNLTLAPGWIPTTIQMIKIPFWIALVNSLGSQPDLFISSFFIPVASLGIYLFAGQMAVQPIQLLSGALQNVLSPYAARIRGDTESENAHIRQSFMSGIVFVPIFVMAVAAVYPSMVHLLFRSAWDDSILPVILASILLIYPTVQVLLEAPIMGAHRWKLVLRLFIGRAIAKCGGALAAVGVIKLFHVPTEYLSVTLILGVGLATTAVSFVQIQQVSRMVGLSRATFSYEIYSTPLYAILAAIATSGLADSVVDTLGISSENTRLEAAIEFAFCVVSYSAVSAVLLRFGYVESLCSLLQLVPQPARRMLFKLLVLEDANQNAATGA
jgi:O-antigen/teichoic acid export membrane protein